MKIPNIKPIIDTTIQQVKSLFIKIKPFVDKLRTDWKDPKKKRVMMAIGIAIILVLIIAVRTITPAVQKSVLKKKEAAKGQKEMAGMDEEAVPVKVYKVKKTDFKDTLPVIGNIKGYKEIDLKFQVAGIMESFNFEEGEKVQEGDIIASIIQKEALLKLRYSEIEMSKNQKLFDIGAVTQMKLDQSKLEYESAKAELDKTNIYAMTNGLLGAKLIDPGSYVTPNDKVGTFVQIDKVYAEFNIIEKDAPKIALGQKVEVFVDAVPAKSFTGTIDRASPIIEGKSRTQVIKIEVENKEGLIKPGMFARALIATYEKKEDLVIPSSGIKKQEADYFVYVVHKEVPKEVIEEKKKAIKKSGPIAVLSNLFPKKKDKKPVEEAPKTEEKPIEYGTVEVRKIKPGYMTQDMIEVAEGLKEEEIIIVEAQEDFKDKQKVELAETQEGLL